jgi:hypothetical protein
VRAVRPLAAELFCQRQVHAEFACQPRHCRRPRIYLRHGWTSLDGSSPLEPALPTASPTCPRRAMDSLEQSGGHRRLLCSVEAYKLPLQNRYQVLSSSSDNSSVKINIKTPRARSAEFDNVKMKDPIGHTMRAPEQIVNMHVVHKPVKQLVPVTNVHRLVPASVYVPKTSAANLLAQTTDRGGSRRQYLLNDFVVVKSKQSHRRATLSVASSALDVGQIKSGVCVTSSAAKVSNCVGSGCFGSGCFGSGCFEIQKLNFPALKFQTFKLISSLRNSRSTPAQPRL